MIENTPKKQPKRNPAEHLKPYQWKEGQSGNPAGKPEGSLSITAAIKRRLKELSPDQKRTALDWLADNIIQDALEHNNAMRKLIWNYVDGMPKQSLEVMGELPFQIIEIGKINGNKKEN